MTRQPPRGPAPRPSLPTADLAPSAQREPPAAAEADTDPWHDLARCVPDDDAGQVDARYYVRRVMTEAPIPRQVMDLGCGRGDSVDVFRQFSPNVDWVGVDIADSREALQRQRTDARFVTYGGRSLPFDEETFDIVYSSHVLEHVREPWRQLTEIARVLRRGGRFIGSTSQLEPYHSRSYWNFTVPGFVAMVHDANLRVEEIRPGIDGVTLILRSFLRRPAGFARWFENESPLNQLVDEWGNRRQARAQEVNLRKLQFAGQFVFLVRKPAE